MKNEPRKIRSRSLRGSRNSRLNVEKLECRRLLAGLNISVTIDTSIAGNIQSNVELPAANRIVYVDLNRNAVADASEPIAITNDAGQAYFEGLEAGDYSIELLTDNYHQRQVFPSVVQQTNELSVPLPSRWLIGNANPEQPEGSLWGLSSDGILTLISGGNQGGGADGTGNGLHVSILEIGGTPESVVHRTPTEAWISYRTASQSRLAVFDTVTKQLSSYNVSSQSKLVDLASDGYSVFGVLQSSTQSEIVKIEVNSLGLSMTEVASGQLTEVDVLSQNFVAIRQQGENRILELINAQGGRQASIALPASANQLQVDSLTGSIAVNSQEGVLVFRAVESDFVKVAVIAEATAPMAMSSGRLIASDRSRRGDLTVWNMSDWTPEGHLEVVDSDIHDVYANGLEAIVLTGDVVHSLDLASARPIQVTLPQNEIAEVKFSVHQLLGGENPQIETPPQRSVGENQSEQVDLRQLLSDVNGHTLWYSVVTQPLHGSVNVTPRGLLEFTPAPDYFGSDSVTVRVHDGVSSADVSLNWSIIEANRPPLAINVHVDQIPEGLVAGSIIGTVSVVDPNANDTYQINSSDPRFRVENGKVILNEPLDFEAGASIVLDLTAIDSLGQFSIASSTSVRLTNVVEWPEGVVLSELSIPENLAGVAVGKLYVISPDADGVYEVSVDDSRFSVIGDELWLLEPLNYEQANSVKLQLTAKDTNHPSLITSTQTTVSVANRDDKPAGILLNSTHVPEQTLGAEVGLISVADEDGDSYVYSVSDERFVVADGILRLADDVSVDQDAELSIPITVTASTANGSIIVFTFPLTVVPPPSPWQNPANPIDVNGDDIVTPIDALHVINFLNNYGPGQVPESDPGASGEDPVYPDVNGDGRVSPIDALLIINFLNDKASKSSEIGGGSGLNGEGEAASDALSMQITSWNEDDERRKNNSKIDAELEQLLDQMSNDGF